jgi:hypothetical protein
VNLTPKLIQRNSSVLLSAHSVRLISLGSDRRDEDVRQRSDHDDKDRHHNEYFSEGHPTLRLKFEPARRLPSNGFRGG